MRLDGFTFPLRTERLVLRPFEPQDFAAYAGWHGLGEVYRYLYAPVPGPEVIRAKFEALLTAPFAADGDALRLAVLPRSGDQPMGEVMLRITSLAALQGEFGYIFAPEAGGKGYATEAVATLLGFGFGQVGFHRLFALLDPENTGSVRVVERLGLRRDAHLVQNDRFDGRWGDEFVYAMLRAEWKARAAAAG
jgi:RimJ/RimL family protein N-acetyltransferase